MTIRVVVVRDDVNGDDDERRKEMERYLSTHPLNEERIAAMLSACRCFSTPAPNLTGATQPRRVRWDYAPAVCRPTRTRRTRVKYSYRRPSGGLAVPELDVEHRPSGTNRVLDRGINVIDRGANAGDHGAMTGPLGRFDDRRMRALLARPDTEAGARRGGRRRARVQGHAQQGLAGSGRRKVELSKPSGSDGVEVSGVY